MWTRSGTGRLRAIAGWTRSSGRREARPGLNLELAELEHLAGSVFGVLEQQSGLDRAADDVSPGSTRVHRKLQVGIHRRRVADRQLAADRGGVAKDERHRGSAALDVTAQLELKPLRRDHILQLAGELAELHVLGRLAKRDRLAEQTDRAGLDEAAAVDPSQGD